MPYGPQIRPGLVVARKRGFGRGADRLVRTIELCRLVGPIAVGLGFARAAATKVDLGSFAHLIAILIQQINLAEDLIGSVLCRCDGNPLAFGFRRLRRGRFGRVGILQLVPEGAAWALINLGRNLAIVGAVHMYPGTFPRLEDA